MRCSATRHSATISPILRTPAALRAALLLAVLAPIGGAHAADAPSTPTPEVVDLGVMVESVYDLSPPSGSFTASFWLWSRHKNRAANPLDTIVVVGAKSVTAGRILAVKRGDVTWTLRHFNAVVLHDWNVRTFPFDHHILHIELDEGMDDSRSLVYRADTTSSRLDTGAALTGWRILGMRFKTSEANYMTTFGDPSLKQPFSRWAIAEIDVPVQRGGVGIFIKLLFGAYVAAAMGMLSFRIKTDQPTLFSARMGLLVGAIFATVVNLRSVESVLGRTDSFTLVDKIHLTIALYILVAMIAALYSRRQFDAGRIDKALSKDRAILFIYAASFVIVNVILISRAVMS